MEKKKVLLGMSGGVDSSVAAILLQEQGYEVYGVTLKLWEEEGKESTCCNLDATLGAKRNSLFAPCYLKIISQL